MKTVKPQIDGAIDAGRGWQPTGHANYFDVAATPSPATRNELVSVLADALSSELISVNLAYRIGAMEAMSRGPRAISAVAAAIANAVCVRFVYLPAMTESAE